MKPPPQTDFLHSLDNNGRPTDCEIGGSELSAKIKELEDLGARPHMMQRVPRFNGRWKLSWIWNTQTKSDGRS